MSTPLFLTVTCITHSRKPVFNAFISQFPPSESGKLRGVAFEAVFYKFLKYDCAITGVLDVALHESGGSEEYCVIQMKKSHPSQVWQALHAVTSRLPYHLKIVIAVDEDIDPRDPDSVNWALCFAMQPHRDTRIVTARLGEIDPSSSPMDDPERGYPKPNGNSSILINATRKWDYPPVSLPKREFMERARRIWEEEGLPKLKPKVPWHGYPLGHWTEENEREARLAVEGKHHETGEQIARQRVDLPRP
ncbi:MAG: UbiD family decarboxylase [Chloroflexi bacterium]|nr:UbiD family decarboxylase [Chloroflexota bacterium]